MLIQITISFESHNGENAGAVYVSLAHIRIAFQIMNGDMFKKTFTTYVRPKSKYGVPLWKHPDRAERVQKCATRMVPRFAGLVYENIAITFLKNIEREEKLHFESKDSESIN